MLNHKVINRTVFLLVAGLLIIPLLSLSKVTGKNKTSTNILGFGFDSGLTTFFGDVDEAPANGDYTNNFAYRASVYKNLWYWLNVEGSILTGNVSGEKKRQSGEQINHIYFDTKFVEFSMNAELNLVPLFLKNRNTKMNVYPSGGIGLISFKSKLYNGADDAVRDSYGYEPGESSPKLALLLGVKLTYRINDQFQIVGLTSNRIINSDYVDSKAGMDKWDFFNYTSLGISYRLFLRSANSSKNSFKGFPEYKSRLGRTSKKSKCPSFK
jgi:hypothetical protein